VPRLLFRGVRRRRRRVSGRVPNAVVRTVVFRASRARGQRMRIRATVAPETRRRRDGVVGQRLRRDRGRPRRRRVQARPVPVFPARAPTEVLRQTRVRGVV